MHKQKIANIKESVIHGSHLLIVPSPIINAIQGTYMIIGKQKRMLV